VIIYEQSEAWCSGLTCRPVKPEIAGSNPVASAITIPYTSPRGRTGRLCRVGPFLFQRNPSPPAIGYTRRAPYRRIPGRRAGSGGGTEAPANGVGGGTGAAERGGADAGLSGGVVNHETHERTRKTRKGRKLSCLSLMFAPFVSPFVRSLFHPAQGPLDRLKPALVQLLPRLGVHRGLPSLVHVPVGAQGLQVIPEANSQAGGVGRA
jgi:hypothetical protein